MPYARPVASFAEIEEEFVGRVHDKVWCSVATVDTLNRPRSRIWHPIWECNIGRVATMRHTLKTKHLSRNPHVSLSYVPDDIWRPVYVDCRAGWEDDPEAKQRLWDMFLAATPPLGYDPGLIFGSVENPEFGALKLEPWRIELVDGPGESRVWRA